MRGFVNAGASSLVTYSIGGGRLVIGAFLLGE